MRLDWVDHVIHIATDAAGVAVLWTFSRKHFAWVQSSMKGLARAVGYKLQTPPPLDLNWEEITKPGI